MEKHFVECHPHSWHSPLHLFLTIVSPKHNMKNKIQLLSQILINSRSIAPAFHALLTTSFSLYSFICLSHSNGYCLTSSHNRPTKPTFKDDQSEEKRYI